MFISLYKHRNRITFYATLVTQKSSKFKVEIMDLDPDQGCPKLSTDWVLIGSAYIYVYFTSSSITRAFRFSPGQKVIMVLDET